MLRIYIKVNGRSSAAGIPLRSKPAAEDRRVGMIPLVVILKDAI